MGMDRHAAGHVDPAAVEVMYADRLGYLRRDERSALSNLAEGFDSLEELYLAENDKVAIARGN